MEQTELIAGAGQVLAQSQALAVKTTAARQQAADLWDACRAFRKQAEAQKEEVCRPLKTAWDDAKKPFDSFVKECQTAEAKLQKVMGDWDREQERIAREEQAKIQAKIDAENAKKLARAEEKGKDLSEVVLKVAPVVQAPPKAIETQAGTVSVRTEKKVYGIIGAADNEDLKANDPRVSTILSAYPSLFSFDWVAFRKIASTGMLDQCQQVASRIEYVYSQRQGR